MSVHSFFRRNAEAFTAGDLEACADTLSTPATIYIGSRQITVADRPALLQVLHTYRANLAVECYACTTCEVTHVTEQHSGRQQAFVTWKNFNDRGAAISTLDAVYILCDAGEGRLQCVTAEVMPPVASRFLSGLALV